MSVIVLNAIVRGNVGPANKRLSLWSGIVATVRLLHRRERVIGCLLAVSMVVNGVLGLIGIAVLLPFVGLMLDQDPLGRPGLIQTSFRLLGIDDVRTAILVTGIALIVLTVAKNAYAIAHLWAVNRYTSNLEVRLASSLLDRIVTAPYVWLVQRNPSVLRDIVIGHVVTWAHNVVRVCLQLVTEAVFLLLAIAFLIAMSPGVGLTVSVISVLLAIILVQSTRRRIERAAEHKRHYTRLLNITSTEAISGGRDVRLAGAARFLTTIFHQEFRGFSRCDVAGRTWQAIPRSGLEVLGLGALVGAALIGLAAGYSRQGIGEAMMLYVVVAVRAIPSISQITTSFATLRGAIPAVSEIVALDGELPPLAMFSDRVPLKVDWREVALKKVSVRYVPNGKRALQGINLSIARRRSYAIVGPSGSGKSTLVDVIAGLIAPNDGDIRVDEFELTPENAAKWRWQVAYVAQTPFLLDGSIADNIVFGLDDGRADPSRLWAAVNSAGLKHFVESLPAGLNTWVGDRGGRLSGGQRQRIAIARALYREADILVLDEATSSLDALTERDIQESLALLSGVATLIVVAHRFSTVRNCDLIMYLEGGRIDAVGTHDELYANHVGYRLMADAQSYDLRAET